MVPAVVQELPMDRAMNAQMISAGRIEEARLQKLYAVERERRDGSRHVPGSDQGAHRQQDEDRCGDRLEGHLAGARHIAPVVAVLECDQRHHHGAQDQSRGYRPVDGIDAEQGDGAADQQDERDERNDGVHVTGFADVRQIRDIWLRHDVPPAAGPWC